LTQAPPLGIIHQIFATQNGTMVIQDIHSDGCDSSEDCIKWIFSVGSDKDGGDDFTVMINGSYFGSCWTPSSFFDKVVASAWQRQLARHSHAQHSFK
jgi:hypothetical protein